MRFTLSQVKPDACPPALVRAQDNYKLDRDYSLDQAEGFGLSKDAVFWFLIHLAESNAQVQARLVVWAAQLGIQPQDNKAGDWGTAKARWQVERAQALHVQGITRDVARAQAAKETYDKLLEVFRA